MLALDRFDTKKRKLSAIDGSFFRLPVPSLRSYYHAACIALIALFAGRTIYFLFSGSSNYLFFVTDDFFYYLIPARNFVHTGQFTFDGITLTNGFHPSWMITIVVLWLLSFESAKLFFFLLTILLSVSAYISFRLLIRLVAVLDLNSPLLPLLLGITLLVMNGLIFIGMEISMTIPLYLLLLISIARYDGSSGADFRTGSIVSLLILSRLDTAYLLLLVLAFVAWQNTAREVLRSYVRILLCLLPVALYVMLNIYYFGSIAPVSSIVKQLHDEHFHFNMRMWQLLGWSRDGMGVFLILPFALLALQRYWREHSLAQSVAIGTALFFPIVFYVIFSLRSDWILFRWYFFPVPVLFLVSTGLLAKQLFTKWQPRRFFIPASVVATGLLVFGLVDFYRHTTGFEPEPDSVFRHAQLLMPFVASHPGRYAMGDRAGLTSFMCNIPIVQLEGISSDMRIVDSIRTEGDFLPMLREYHVDYLIESSDSSLARDRGGFFITTPHRSVAGTYTLAMHATLTEPPVFHLATSPEWGWDTTGTRTGAVNTYVFRIR